MLPAFTKQLEQNDPNLTELDIHHFHIKTEMDVINLMHALQTNTHLTDLYFTEVQIDSNAIRLLGDSLKQNTTLSTLFMKSCELQDDAAIALADALMQNTTLNKLYLDDNKITDTGATALANALKQNTTLSMLSLRDNRIGNQGANALAKMLGVNRSLTELYLLGNFAIRDEGKADLKEALKHNGMIIGFSFPELKNTQQYTDRNRIAHKKVREAVIEILKGDGDYLKKHDIEEKEITAFLEALLKRGAAPNAQLAYKTWQSRGEPKWWTDLERRASQRKTRAKKTTAPKKIPKRRGDDDDDDDIQMCIQCKAVDAVFYEEHNPNHLFCGSYCQWIKHTGAPDVRGKTVEEIRLMLSRK
jgi:hypothetical protein